MSAVDTLTVATAAGLSLELRFHRAGRDRGLVDATLSTPERLAPQASWLERQCAFFASAGAHFRVDHGRVLPSALWIGHAAIYLDAATAATVQAWLDSREVAAPAPAPCANAYAQLAEDLSNVAYRSAQA